MLRLCPFKLMTITYFARHPNEGPDGEAMMGFSCSGDEAAGSQATRLLPVSLHTQEEVRLQLCYQGRKKVAMTRS